MTLKIYIVGRFSFLHGLIKMIPMKTGYKVCDAMTKKPIVVSKTKTIAECARIMQKENIGSLVIGENKNLQGIITEQDLVRKAVALNLNAEETPVEKIMVKRLFTVSPEIDLFDAVQLMNDYDIKHMPVIAQKKVIGYLTLKDILRIQPQLCELIIDKFQVKKEDHKPFYFRKENSEDVCLMCGK